MRSINYILLTILLSLVRSLPIHGQENIKRNCSFPTPQSICTSLLPNGDIAFSWSKPSEPNSAFIRYELFSKESVLPLGITKDIDSNFFTISSAYASNHFFVAYVSLCGSSTEFYTYSDTVVPIRMNAIKMEEGVELLQWNSPFSSYNHNYEIQRKHPINGWETVTNVGQKINSFLDTIDICDKNYIEYRISSVQEGCTSYSNFLGDTLIDKYYPYTPVIHSVTFDTLTPGVKLIWNKNFKKDVLGYEVSFSADPSKLPIRFDTVHRIINTIDTFYTITTINVKNPLRFSVAAYDFCPTIDPATNQTSANANEHKSMYLDYSYSICQKKVNLTWTNYSGWNEVVQYKIYAKKENEFWKLIDSTKNQFYATTIEEFKNYTFIVEAVSDIGEKAFSSKVLFYSKSPTLPKFNFIEFATLDGDKISIKHQIDYSQGISALSLQRKNKTGFFEEIERKPILQSINYFTDTFPKRIRESQSYRIQIIDSCGTPTTFSDEVTTIFASISSLVDSIGTVQLNWTPYQGFQGGVKNYLIFRGINGVFDALPLVSLPNNTYFFEDNLKDSTQLNGKICYRIEAIEQANKYSISASSSSNITCSLFEPIIYVPNAFVPSGVNKIFKPICTNIQSLKYSFSIQNRWGQTIFQTTSIDEGWDGMIDGQVLAAGLYVYTLDYLDGNNKQHIERGIVNLLK
jgi:gliding motility-associated-like protein